METLKYDPLLTVNEDVKTLQRMLNVIRVKYNGRWEDLSVDGRFGEKTETAVKAFQRLVHFNDNGIVDDQTWSKIDQMYNFLPELNVRISDIISSSKTVGTSSETRQTLYGIPGFSMGNSPDGVPLFSMGISHNEYMCEASPDDFRPMEDAMADDDRTPLEIMMLSTENAIDITLDAATIGTVIGSNYVQWNELWHVTKTKGIVFRWDKRWNKYFSVANRNKQISTVANARTLAKGTSKLGKKLIVADIALSGEIKPSHAIDAAVLAASATGVGALVGAGWLIADYGTMTYNRIFNGEWKSLSDIIDEKIGTVELYEGFY